MKNNILIYFNFYKINVKNVNILSMTNSTMLIHMNTINTTYINFKWEFKINITLQ